MLWDLNDSDYYDNREQVTIDWVIYDLNKFDSKLKKELAYMISQIDESKDIVQQREPIVNTILKEWNDINHIQIISKSDLLDFIRIIKLKVWDL